MVYFEKYMIDQTSVSYLLDLYRNSTNWVNIDGVWSERHTCSNVGHFLLSSFSADEVQPVWSIIKDKVIKHTDCDVELAYARILKYNQTCFIQNHRDSFNSKSQKESDISLILQLSSPSQYRGGKMIVSGEVVELQRGDAVFYTYDHAHEVTRIEAGIRYVLNLRLKRVNNDMV